MSDSIPLKPTYPLARDRAGRAVELPPEAEGFAVFKVPSKEGGRPQPWIEDGEPVVIGLSVTEEEFRDAVDAPGVYRLDVVDVENRRLGRSCWVKLKPLDASAPAQKSGGTVEIALLKLIETNTESLRIVADSNRQLADALARSRTPVAAAGGTDDLDAMREGILRRLREIEDARDEKGEPFDEQAALGKIKVLSAGIKEFIALAKDSAEHAPALYQGVKAIQAMLAADRLPAPPAPKNGVKS
jgi:hypothetical protein